MSLCPGRHFDSKGDRRFEREPRRADARRGVAVVELLIILPVLLVALFAMVEFGLIMAQLKQIVLASREGAKAASELPPGTLPTTDGTNVNSSILDAVDHQLLSAKLKRCKIIFRHNNGPPAGTTVTNTDTSSTCTKCATPTSTLPSTTTSVNGVSVTTVAVEVSVCVPLSTITPNILSHFGFAVKDQIVYHTTTFNLEQDH